MRRLAIAITVVCVASGVVGADGARAADPYECSRTITERGDDALTPAEHYDCVRAIASTYLDAQRNAIAPEALLLADEVIRYQLGPRPEHRPGGAAVVRASYPTDIAGIAGEQWVIDGNTAFVSYDVYNTSAPDERALVETDRITLKRGLIWEILTVSAPPPGEGYGYPSSVTAVVVGVPPDNADHTQPNFDDGHYCSIAIADGVALTEEAHRRCLIAIATTYLDSEENSAPGWAVLMDPRGVGHSQGQVPRHRMGNGDVVRGRQGVTGPNGVIKDIANREFAVDGDGVWVRYDGYTQLSVGSPDFYVMERFTIRYGLIWEIMVPPIAACPLGGNCFIAYL